MHEAEEVFLCYRPSCRCALTRRAMPGHSQRALTMPAIDLSHTIESGMITYRGLPGPIICDYLSRESSRSTYAPGTEFQIGKIDMVGNSGTYLDSPFHRYREGADLSALSLSYLADVACVVARVDPAGRERTIRSLPLDASQVRGKAVLIHTGWDRHWRTDAYFEGHPHLSAETADWLAQAGARLVGIDSYNIDGIDTGERPVHSILLKHGIPIVEHLCELASVPDAGARFFAVPPKVKAFGTFPVRAFVLV
jgi:arylformamidase